MVRNRKRKTDRASTPQEVIVEAIKAVSQKELSYLQAAEKYGIPLRSLKRYCKKASTSGHGCPITYGFQQVRKIFSTQEEEDLTQYLKQASDVYFGLSSKEVRKFAYQFATSLNRKVPESWEKNQQAGEDWFRLFSKRNSSLYIRRPEATTLVRAKSFNRTNLEAFFKLLTQYYKNYSFRPEDIWNMDEIGISTVQRPERVISRRKFKQISKAVSSEGGDFVTLSVAVSAAGNKIPPLFIFLQGIFQDHFINGAPTGSIGCCNPSGWMKEQHFLMFAEHFVQHTKSTKEKPTLLLLDNHESHLSISAFKYLEANGVVVLSFPLYCSHMLQPLDRSIYGPLKRHVNSACDTWHRNNPGKTITVYDIPDIVATALPLATTESNIKAGFAMTGISPLNTDIFLDWEFLPSFVMDWPEAMPDELQSGSMDLHPPCTSLMSVNPGIASETTEEQAKSAELTLNFYLGRMFT